MRNLRIISACLLGAACAESTDLTWTEGPGYRWRALADAGRGTPGFTRLEPGRTGITFENSVSDSALLQNQILANGAGVALADVDGDGRVDIFLTRTEGPNALYRNLGGWRFRDIADSAGVAAPDRASSGAAFADVDGDGDADLLLAAIGGPNALFRNDGAGRFTEDSFYPGRESRMGSSTIALADVDGDGDLDVYTANYKAYTTQDLYSPQQRAFDQVVRQLGPRQFEVRPQYRDDYKVILRDDLRGVSLIQRADPDVFYLNDGAGRFAPVPIAQSPRFVDENGGPFDETPDNFTLAARFYDVNGDLAPDLYVANDFEDPDQFWLNDGRGFFRLIPRVAQRTTSNAAMAVDFGDVNRDGAVDFFEVDMLSRETHALRAQIPTHTALPKFPGVIEDRPQLQRNTLFLNRGDGTFAQIAELAGVDASGWTWSTVFLDVDLDGWEDILAGTGNVWDFMDADTQERLRNRLTDLDWRQQRMTYPKLEVPNYAFRNRGDLTFEDVSQAWRFSAGPDISHGMATGDLDGDGDQEVVLNRFRAPALVLRNDGRAPRIAVRLRGRAPNTAGIGAKVRVTGGPVSLQEREMTAGGLYLSGGEALLTFATGSADSVALEVIWRDGSRSVIPDARPNRLYEVNQDGAAAPSSSSFSSPPRPLAASPLFTDESAPLAHQHTEIAFDDASRQLLLPLAFSQLGPGVSWLDLNGDGRDDLLVGTGRSGKLGAWLNRGGRLVPTTLPVETPGDLTTILAVPRPGGSRLLVGLSSYEMPTPNASVGLPSVIGLDLDPGGRPVGRTAPVVPGDTASIGPLALADYDGDGDLDLFVGGRVIPGAYPLSPSSRLFRNDGAGGFDLDLANSALLHPVGMVSAALWSDLDQDGDPDLAMAVEWGPVKVFWNDGGSFRRAPESFGLDQYYSRWLGLASGDFDADGRLDLVATSWGRNTRPRVDSTLPLYLYFGNFSTKSTLDLLLAQHDDRLNALAPLNTFARLSLAVPGLAQRMRTFHAFADATVDQVLGAAAPQALRLGVSGLDHLLFVNRGDRFEARPLPMEAQFAPAFAPVVGDFNGDGNEDLVLSQNFFPTDLSTPRYDAGRSLLLHGDGQGGFTAVPGQHSGLQVYGDQRGAAAADYDGDGRLDVAITQNGAPTRLYRNQGARRGLRVRLAGPEANPRGIGAQVRLRYADGWGPTREVQAGSGYWSVNGATQVLGLRGTPAELQIRWPGGRTTEVPIPPGAPEVTARP
jgi:hypothetical protein